MSVPTRNPVAWLIAVGSSPDSTHAASYVARRLAKHSDVVRLTYAISTSNESSNATTPAIGNALAMRTTLREAHQKDQENASMTLAHTAVHVRGEKWTPECPRIELHTIPCGAGGAGVATALEAFASACKAIYPSSVLVTGSRGLTRTRAALAALMGNGSVSASLVHDSPVPVLVVGSGASVPAVPHAAKAATEEASPRTFVVALDGSPVAAAGFRWVLTELAEAGDKVEVVSVVGLPAGAHLGTNDLERCSDEEARLRVNSAGDRLDAVVEEAVEAAPEGVTVTGKVLAPTTEGIADALSEHARARNADLLVTGNRGMGALKRTVLGFAGVGSVSDALLRSYSGALLVWKDGSDEE